VRQPRMDGEARRSPTDEKEEAFPVNAAARMDERRPTDEKEEAFPVNATARMDSAGAKRALEVDTSGSNEARKRPRAIDVHAAEASVSSSSPVMSPAVPSPSADELISAAPKLAAAIRATAKAVKVAEKMASLLEDGRSVKLSNACAVFDVLSAGAEDPKRFHKPGMRAAHRRLYRAAAERSTVFPSHQQHMLRLWSLAIVTQIDLHDSLANNNSPAFSRAVLDVKRRLQQLPCANPSDEPPLQPGTWREYLPERVRPTWVRAIWECLEVVTSKSYEPAPHHQQYQWARPDANMLVKLTVDRRQHFSAAQQEKLSKWDRLRKASAVKAHNGL